MSDSDSGTRLETGYGPATPPGDNLCNDFVQETAASFAALARARGDRVERLDGIVTMTDAAMPLPFWNRAVLEQPVGDVDAAVIRRTVASSSSASVLPFSPTGTARPARQTCWTANGVILARSCARSPIRTAAMRRWAGQGAEPPPDPIRA